MQVMRHIDRINKKYEEAEVTLLYNKAVDLLDLLNDEEYEQLITENPQTFILASHPERGEYYLQDKKNLVAIIDIITNFIVTRGLTKDEYEVMTLDEIKSYIKDTIDSITVSSNELYLLIKSAEALV